MLIRNMKILTVSFLIVFSFNISLASSNECLKAYVKRSTIGFNDLVNQNLNSKLANNYQLDFVNLFSIIEENYAPLIFKSKYENFDWNQIKKETLKASLKVKSEPEIFQLYSELLFKFNDAHVSIQGPSNLVWKIPLQMDYVSGKYLINYLSPEFPEGQKKPEVGDEVIAINGQSIDEFRTQFQFFNSHANKLTNKRLFAVSFPQWSEAVGLPLSFLNWKELKLEIKNSNMEQYTILLPIKKEGVGFKELFLLKKESIVDKISESVLNRNTHRDELSSSISLEFKKVNAQSYDLLNKILKLTNMLTLSGFSERVSTNNNADKKSEDEVGKRIEIGGLESMFEFPDDFKKIEVKNFIFKIPFLKEFISSNFFQAGTFVKNNKKVGYLRIPSYAPSVLFTILPFLRFTISELEKNSDYLIIDQTNNPGGYVVLSDWIIFSLTGEYNYKKHLRFAAKPTISFLRSYTEILDGLNQLEGVDPAKQESLKKRAEAELDKIHFAYKNNKILTEPLDMTIMSELAKIISDQFLMGKNSPQIGGSPNQWILNKLFGIDVTKDYVYSKPVYFITNELDFSGADATPASLQDYGRAKIIGTRTAGAGGTVEEFQIRSFIETTIRLTTSLMVRYNGNLVENYGVIPDYIVERTPEDLTGKNREYFRKINDVIMSDLKKH